MIKNEDNYHRLVDGTADVVTYCLRLENGCYYIGTTRHLKKRIRNHFSGNGSKWCRMNKPLRVIGIAAGDIEEELVKRARDCRGKEKVRGWKWVNTADPDKTLPLNYKPYL